MTATTIPAVPARLDHLMLVVGDLARGVQEFAELTGVRPVRGGRHTSGGTANYLVGVHPLPGVDALPPYLEILGPDPEAAPEVRGLRSNLIGDASGPVLRTWLVRARDIEQDVLRAAEAGYPVGDVGTLSRLTPEGQRLQWRLSRRRDLVFGGAQPGIIDWGEAAHPSEGLEPQITIESIEVAARDVAAARGFLGALGLDVAVRQAEQDSLVARLGTPKGPITISAAGVR
ncbi:MAG: VOC family protein [Propionibacterium sp.]|nr:VOC family protein [Propionibacterium sp.]